MLQAKPATLIKAHLWVFQQASAPFVSHDAPLFPSVASRARKDRGPCEVCSSAVAVAGVELAPLVEEHGWPERLLPGPSAGASAFTGLARTIVGQQLSWQVARVIFQRVQVTCGVRRPPLALCRYTSEAGGFHARTFTHADCALGASPLQHAMRSEQESTSAGCA